MKITMKFWYKFCLILTNCIILQSCAQTVLISHNENNAHQPYLFNVQQQIPSVIVEMKYLTTDNFVGTIVDGYKANICFLSQASIDSLKIIQKKLLAQQKSLKFFDCYRPQQAVDHFWRWANAPDALDRAEIREKYYPHIYPKQELFKGYIAKKSGHSRGSTVDMMIFDLAKNENLDMGSEPDMLDPISHTASKEVTIEAQANRAFIKKIMEDHGWKNYDQEWWHYTLKNEPYPKTYFNFTVQE